MTDLVPGEVAVGSMVAMTEFPDVGAVKELAATPVLRVAGSVRSWSGVGDHETLRVEPVGNARHYRINEACIECLPPTW